MNLPKNRPMVSKKVKREPQLKTNTLNDFIKYEKNKRHLQKAKKFFSFFRGVAVGVGTTVLITTDIDIILPISLTVNAIIASYLIDYTTLRNVSEFKLVEPK